MSDWQLLESYGLQLGEGKPTFWDDGAVLFRVLAGSTEKCGIAGHKILMGGELFPMADISPVMSASIPAGSASAVSDVGRVSRD